MTLIVIQIIKFYRFFISPLLGQNCRFYPSCSAYSLEAVQKHGSLIGILLTLRRLSKCHPFHEGGIDKVPDTLSFKPRK